MAQGIESKAGPKDVVDDYDAICRVVQLAQEGDSKGDAAKLKEAFHVDAQLFGTVASEYGPTPNAKYSQQRATNPADTGIHRWRILSVQQTGGAAAAVVAEDGYFGWRSNVSYVLLARIDGAWKIVSIEFQQTGGERPAGAQ